MRSVASYLLLLFMVIFWIFRVIVAFTNSIGVDIGFIPMNMEIEIVLLFVTLLCIIYLISYAMYFGVDFYGIIINLINGQNQVIDYTKAMASFIGIIIPIAVFFSLLIDKNRREHPVDKKTDWFYKNEQYDRKLDERADQNNYRNY